MAKLSIIIPAYNEEKVIENTLINYLEYFQGKISFEILVVINNTSDKTEEIVKNFSEKHKEIRYLNFIQGGKGFAIIKGFKDALKRDNDLIGFVDADMSTEPESFYDLVREINNNNNYDGVIASRRMKTSMIERGVKRNIISWVFNSLVRTLFLFPYKDSQAGAKVFKRKSIEEVINNLTQTQWIFDIDLLYQLKRKGFDVLESPTVWRDNENKSTKLFSMSINMFLELIKFRIKTLLQYSGEKK